MKFHKSSFEHCLAHKLLNLICSLILQLFFHLCYQCPYLCYAMCQSTEQKSDESNLLSHRNFFNVELQRKKKWQRIRDLCALVHSLYCHNSQSWAHSKLGSRSFFLVSNMSAEANLWCFPSPLSGSWIGSVVPGLKPVLIWDASAAGVSWAWGKAMPAWRDVV